MSIKNILSVASALCLACIAPFATGCQKTSEDVIRESIIERFEPYRNMDESVVSRLSKTAEDEGLPEMRISGDDCAYAILDGFGYSIGKIEVKDKGATAQVMITSKNIDDLMEKLEGTDGEFDLLRAQTATQDAKADKIREIIMQAIKDTDLSEEEITLRFSLNGTEWTSTNATEELGKLNSVIFSS